MKYLISFWILAASSIAAASADSEVAHKLLGITGAKGFIKGVVSEVVQTERYTYLQLKTLTRSVWVASYKFAAEEGDLVRFVPTQPLTNFKSPTLKRVFASIYFVDSLEKAKHSKSK